MSTTTIGFRPTERDLQILRDATRPDETTSDTIRRALRLLEHQQWLDQFHEDAERLKDEDVNSEPEAW